MRVPSFSFLLLSVFTTSVLAQTETTDTPDPPTPTPTGIDVFANVTLYQPDDPSTPLTAPRTQSLPNATVLAAWTDASSNGSLAIYRSTNSGFSWYAFGTATHDAGKQLLQPHLLWVNGSAGDAGDADADAGTVLLAVTAVDALGTAIEVYSSGDAGESWELVGEVASGGQVGNASAAVGDPFLVRSGEAVSVLYTHARKIVQQTSSGGEYDAWGAAVDVVASTQVGDGPSAPSVAQMGTGKYIIAFQYGLTDAANKTTYPVYYKMAANPQNAGSDAAQAVRVDTGVVPSGAPSVAWSALGGVNGTLVLSDSRSSSVFVNQALGEGAWREVKSTAGRAVAREVAIPPNDQTKVRIAGGFSGTGGSQILVTVMDLQKAIGARSG